MSDYGSESLINKDFDLEKMGQSSEYYDGTNKSFKGDKSVRSALDEIGYLDITSQEVVTTKQKTQIDNKLKSVMSEVKDLEEKLKKLKNFFSTNEGKITDRIKDAFKSKSTKEREEKEKKEADLKSERDKIQKEYDKLLNELEKLNQRLKSAKEYFDAFQMGYGNFDEKSYDDHADEILADIKVVKEKIKKIHNNRIPYFRLEINSQKEKLLGIEPRKSDFPDSISPQKLRNSFYTPRINR